jgi:hypothetical protein
VYSITVLFAESLNNGCMNTCKHCQFKLPDQSRFCPDCGECTEKDLGALLATDTFPAQHCADISAQESCLALMCPVCQKLRPIGFRYCISDGYPFDGVELNLLGASFSESLRRDMHVVA